MAKSSRQPPYNPVKDLPPVSKTQDTSSHHTSPNKGPQPTPAGSAPAAKPIGKKISRLPEAPAARNKHSDD
jgi:hypothetical protein